MSYLIKRDNKTNTITYMEYDLKGYKFTPKSKENAKVHVNQIMIINPELIDKILTIKYNSMYKKLVTFIREYLSDANASEGNGVFALTEIDRLKSIIMNKYKAYISREKQKLFLENLAKLEKQIQMKMLMQYQFTQGYMPNYHDEEITQGRGR